MLKISLNPLACPIQKLGILILLGFDVTYSSSYSDGEIADIAETENRIVLTRDTDLLKRKKYFNTFFNAPGVKAFFGKAPIMIIFNKRFYPLGFQ